MLYIRGQEQDYNTWRQLGNVGWSWKDVLPYFLKSENQERGKSKFHGVGGPISVEDQRIQLDILDVFVNAAVEVGIPKVNDFNTGDNFGCGYFQVTEKNGLRCSASVGYLKPIKNRNNLKIITKAHVKNIDFDKKKAVGVSYWLDNQLIKTKAKKEIILSAGSIGSPHILQASGIGDPHRIKNHGIEILHNSPGVGKNLQDHIMMRPVYKVKKIKTLNKKINSFFGKMQIGM